MWRAQLVSAATALSSCLGGTVHNTRGTTMCLGTTRAGDTQQGHISVLKEKAVGHSESLKTCTSVASQTHTVL